MLEPFSKAQEGVEELMPAHLMALVVTRLYTEGYELRLDTRGYLGNSVRATMKKHPGQEAIIAREADLISKRLLRLTAFDNAVCATLAVSMFLLKLVDEQLYLDTGNQAILSALMIVTDAKDDDNPDMAGYIETATRKAGGMLDECLRQGLYQHTVVRN